MFPEKAAQPTLKALTSALSDFQSLFTEVYNAIKKGQEKGAGVLREMY